MRIHINGDTREFSGPLTVSELLDSLDISGQRIAVELNNSIVPRSAHASQQVQTGDRLEIVHAIGGGST